MSSCGASCTMRGVNPASWQRRIELIEVRRAARDAGSRRTAPAPALERDALARRERVIRRAARRRAARAARGSTRAPAPRAARGRSRRRAGPSRSASIWACGGSSRERDLDVGELAAERAQQLGQPAVRERRRVADRDAPALATRRALRVSCSASSTASKTRRACSRSVAPAAVSSTCRRDRSKSVTPSSLSSAWICRLSGGCAIARRCAARPKCRSSATATK